MTSSRATSTVPAGAVRGAGGQAGRPRGIPAPAAGADRVAVRAAVRARLRRLHAAAAGVLVRDVVHRLHQPRRQRRRWPSGSSGSTSTPTSSAIRSSQVDVQHRLFRHHRHSADDDRRAGSGGRTEQRHRKIPDGLPGRLLHPGGDEHRCGGGGVAVHPAGRRTAEHHPGLGGYQRPGLAEQHNLGHALADPDGGLAEHGHADDHLPGRPADHPGGRQGGRRDRRRQRLEDGSPGSPCRCCGRRCCSARYCSRSGICSSSRSRSS